MENTGSAINNLFLIGAGFTKAVFPNAPLNRELLQKLIDSCKPPPNRNRIELNVNGEKILKTTLLKKYSEKYKTSDIEVLLTRLDLEISTYQKNALKNERKEIEGLLVQYFRQFRPGYNQNLRILEKNTWLKSMALELFGPNDAIITTNYDCFVEGLLDYYEVWNPTEGYVNAYDPSTPTNFPEKLKKNPKGIKFYKIHGSEHFIESKVFGEDGETEKTIIGFIINENIYPVSGKNRHLGWLEIKNYIIAPSFVKIPHFQIADMVNKAIDVAKTAQNMVIIGSGLRDEDIFLRSILTSFINHTLQNKKKLITVDPNADSILGKIENFWMGGTQNITFHKIPKNIEDGLCDLIKLLEDV